MSVESGALRHRALIENKSVTYDPLGGEIVTWVPISTIAGDGYVWVNAKFPSGIETLRNNIVLGISRASFRARYRDDVGQTSRLTFRGRVYDIKSVQPDSESGMEFMDLVAEAGANQG